MGETSVILGVKIIRKGDSILLSQEHYVEKLLRKYKYYDFKSMSIPYDVNSQLKKIEENQFLKLNMTKSLGAYCI